MTAIAVYIFMKVKSGVSAPACFLQLQVFYGRDYRTGRPVLF